jgi:N-carbamoylputrescine amidase
VLALLGAEIICVPTASSAAAAELFVPSIRTWANQNVLYAVAANRAGVEQVQDAVTDYFGRSCIASPRGALLAQAEGEGGTAIVSVVARDEIGRARQDLTMYRDRRPELYRLIGER